MTMISERDRNILNQFASCLKVRYPDTRVWLFGSRARGDAQDDSDFDMCIVMDIMDKERNTAINDIAWEVAFDNGTVITTVRYTREEFETGPRSKSPLTKNILREGVRA